MFAIPEGNDTQISVLKLLNLFWSSLPNPPDL